MADHFDLTPDPASVVLQAGVQALRAAQSAQTAPSGSASYTNADGTRTLLGVAAGTSGVAPWVGDTTAPGKPTGISATSHNGIAVAAWDGTLDGGVPADFGHVEITASYTAAGVATTLDLGSLAAAGTLATGVIAGGTVVTLTAVAYDDAHAQDGTSAPNASPTSDPVTVTVQSSVDPAIVAELGDKIAAAQQTLDQAQTDITDAQSAADNALSVANLAQAAAAGLVSASIAAPAAPPSGAIWFPLDASGRVIGMRLWNGTAWTSYTLMADQLLVPGSVGTVSIADGKITTPKLAADVLDVKNFTATGTSTLAEAVAQAIWAGIVNAQAANIQDLHATDAAIDSAVIGKLAAQIITSSQFWTALSGARVGMDAQGIHAYNSDGQGTFNLSGDTGNINGMDIAGSNISGSSFSLQGLGTGSGSHTWIGDDFSSLTKTAPATSGGIGNANSSDAYNYWRLDSFTSGSTLTASSAPLASARNGQGIRFTYSGTGWWSWLMYAGTTLPTVVPYTGTKTVSVWVRSSISTSGAYLYLGTKRSDGTAGTTSGPRLTLTPGVWTQITATVPQEYTLTDITLDLGTGRDAGTVDIDDFSVTSVTQGSSIVLDYDGNGNAEIVILDPAGTRVGVLNGVDNKLSGELVAGTAHLTGWKSDDGTNTRSGLVFDDANGIVANDTTAVSKPRLISNKDSSGNVDTFISTGTASSGKQSLVQVSQSMSKATITSTDGTYQSEVAVGSSGLSHAWGSSSGGSSGMQWGNGYVDFLGMMGHALSGSVFNYGRVDCGTISAGGWSTVTVTVGGGTGTHNWLPLISIFNAGDGQPLVSKLTSFNKTSFTAVVENRGSSNATICGFLWFAVRSDGVID